MGRSYYQPPRKSDEEKLLLRTDEEDLFWYSRSKQILKQTNASVAN